MAMRMGDKFFELSSEGRQDIVQSLLETPKRHTEIASELKMTPGEVSRNLQRLVDSSFIVKGSDTRYQVTKYGELLLDQLQAIDFFEQNQGFFNTHDLSCIPSEFISPQTFSKTEIISGTPKVMSYIWKLTEASDELIWSILDSPLKPIIDENIKKVKNGVHIRTIIPSSEEVPAEYVGIFGVSLDLRRMKDVRFYLKANEKMILLALPDINGQIDYSEALISVDQSFLNWGKNIFNYFWDISEPIEL